MNELQLSNQEATHFIWDNQFTMGTDRAIWITMPIWELSQGGLRFPPKPDIRLAYLRNSMVCVISELNGCTYKLDANNQRVLMYAPLLSDGSYETAGSAYDWVEWDRLDPDVLEEADRIHKLLLAEV